MRIKTHRSHPGTRLRATLFAMSLAGCVLGLPTGAFAQQADQDTAAAPLNAPRWNTTFELPAAQAKSAQRSGREIQLEIAPGSSSDEAADPSDKSWEVQVSRPSGDVIFRDSFPGWATKPQYTYTISTAAITPRDAVVLLSSIPTPTDGASPDAPQFQIAWLVSGKKWQRIGTAKYSLLDGGAQLELTTIDQKTRLVRSRPANASIFCGVDKISAETPPILDVYNRETDTFDSRVDVETLLKGARHLESEPAEDNFNPPYLQAWSQWFAASSDRRSLREQGAKIRPLELGDRKFDTAWFEGAEGLGRGEFVSTQINDAIGLSSVRIVPGVGNTEARLKAFARPTKVLLSLSDGSRFIVPIKPVSLEGVKEGRGVLVTLPEAIKTRCLTVMLLESTPGTPQKDQPKWAQEAVAIAQITPYSSLHFGDARQTAERIVDRVANEPDPRLRGRIAQMALALKTPLTDEVRRAARKGTPTERKRIMALIGSLPANEASALLIGFLRVSEPGAPEYRTVKRALASLQQHAAPGLLAYLNENSIESAEKQVDILRLVGRVANPQQLQQLINELGHGTIAVRNERIRALSAGGKTLVEPLLAHAHTHPDVVSGYDALQALNLLGRRLHYKGQGQLPRPALYKTLIDNAKNRRTLLRVLEVAKYFHVPDFVGEIAPKFIENSDPLIRQATVQALTRYPTEDARLLIAGGLTDASPDVRIAAISALTERQDAHLVLEDVLKYARSERWPVGLGKAFEVLATIDDPRVHQAFARVFEQSPNSEAALIAARELERADTPIDANLAIKLIKDASNQADLRLKMIDLLGLDSSPAGEEFLLELLNKQGWTALFEVPRDQLNARQHLFMALGRRRSLAARAYLLEIVRVSDDLKLQQIALRSLAFYKDQPLLDALEARRKTATPELQGFIDQTITMVERRQALDTIREGVRDVAEDIAPSDTPPPNAASPDPKSPDSQ